MPNRSKQNQNREIQNLKRKVAAAIEEASAVVMFMDGRLRGTLDEFRVITANTVGDETIDEAVADHWVTIGNPVEVTTRGFAVLILSYNEALPVFLARAPALASSAKVHS